MEASQPTEGRLHLPRILRELGRWLALAALTLNIAALTQSPYWISPEALGVVKNWRELADEVRNLARDVLGAYLDIHLSWVSARFIPTLLVLIGIALLGLRRRLWFLQSGENGSTPVHRSPAMIAVAIVLIFVILALEQSAIALPPEASDEAHAFFNKCKLDYGLSDAFDALCVFVPTNNAILHEVMRTFGPLDWLIIIAYLAALAFVVVRYSAEVIFAFVLAAALVAIAQFQTTTDCPPATAPPVASLALHSSRI